MGKGSAVRMMTKMLATAIVILFLFFPYIIWFSKIGSLNVFWSDELYLSWQYTLMQAAMSATFTLVLGFLGAMGLVGIKKRKAIEFLLMVPSLFPVIFVIISMLSLWQPFPFGFWGIVILHVSVYLGLISTFIARLLDSRLHGFAEAALVMGSSRLRFYQSIVVPHLRKDLTYLWLYVFAFCFSSFAIPLIVGRTSDPVLEVLVYKKIFVEAQFGEAMWITWLQFSQMVLFSWLLFSIQQPTENGRAYNNSSTVVRPLIVIPLGVSLTIVISNTLNTFKNFDVGMASLSSRYWDLAFGSFSVGLGVGGLTCMMLLLMAVAHNTKFIERLYVSYVSPSTVLLAFCFLVLGAGSLGGQTSLESYIKVVVGITLLTLPPLYRLRWATVLSEIKKQCQIAELMGAGLGLQFRKIIWPLVTRDVMFLSGLAAFWSVGDFAYSSLVSGQITTLGLLMSSLLTSYRIEAAQVLMCAVLFVGFVCYCLFNLVGYVFSRKFN